MSSKGEIRVLFAGGGTGGHVYPAIAIAQALMRIESNIKIQFAGTRSGIEKRAVPRAGFTLQTIWISGFIRGRLFRNLTLPLKLAVSFFQSNLLIRSFRPHVVVGTGGYVMGPVLWMAQRMQIPTIIQEQNSLPGMTTRKLAGRATVVCAGFPEAIQRIGAANVVVTGNPVRSDLQTVDKSGSARVWNLDESRLTMLIFGGSLGARSINEAVADALSTLLESYNVIWQTGKSGVPARLSRELIHGQRTAGRLAVLDFIDDMPSAYDSANIAICRAGAMTLAELALAGLPAILVPYPHAADNHQAVNARSVSAAGAASVIDDRELTGARLITEVERALGDAARTASMSAAMSRLARPTAASDIAQIVLRAANRV